MVNNNVLVAQSGGPSPVINASLLGVIVGAAGIPECFSESSSRAFTA